MTKKVFSIRDSQTGIYNLPFFQHTSGEAERTTLAMMEDKRALPAQFPEHFDLFLLGDFDDNSGKFEPLDTPQHVVKLIDLKTVHQALGLNNN